MTDLTRQDPTRQGPWGPRSAARAVEAAEQAVRTSVPAVAPGLAAPQADAPVRFYGQAGAFFGLLLKGFLLQLVTLGIYRFWLTTDIRRFYWGHTTVGPEYIAYTGFGMELFKGFLVALTILVPIQAAAFFLALGLPGAQFVISIGVVLIFLFLGQYAVYAARRYRLSRSAFRGLRLRMTGSAWTYAAKAFGLSVLVILTLGLAYPWVATVLERIKMRETFYGDVQGAFVGTAGTLLRRGIVLWALAVSVPLAIITSVVRSLPDAFLDRLVVDLAAARVPQTGEILMILLAGMGVVLAILAVPLLLFPAFQAIVFRWRMEGMRIGGASLSCAFTVGTSYRVYILGFLGIFAVMSLVSSAATGVVYAAVPALVGYGAGLATEIVGILLAMLLYIIGFGTYWIIKQLFIDLALYRARAQSLSVVNLSALDGVTARNVDASAMGDSLGDAVDFGIGI
ncbi:DUF898 family protein [Phreatobacter sp.]|uniref:DUF898 family protein n=1 Tax=Phreatobacter sp. TaxID=1966341 RepID=UPI003F725B55